jgi:nitrogen-specific signal transduction histidine kinase
VEERLRLNQLLADKIAELTRLLNAEHPQPKNQTTTEQQILQLSALAERLSRTQAAQAAIAEGVSIGLAAADLDGRVWFCNPTLRVQSGLQTGDDLDSRLVPDWLSNVQWHEALECLRRGQPTPVWQVAQGERWFALHGEPLCYLSADVWATEGAAGDCTTGLLLVVEDVTAARQQVQELQQLNRLKDEFVSTVSHELRTPMANIKMAVHLLRSSRSDQQRRQYLTILQQECAREIELINNLLDLQRLEANRTTFSPSPIAPTEWLQKVIEPFCHRCENREQYLKVVIPDALPTLITDSAALERIVAELLNNACKYTPPDHVIELFARSTVDSFVLSVRNWGVEVPSVDLERIFEKFYRVPTTDRWHQGGTGLGLALVRKLALQLGGTIRATSGDGSTTFTLTLPLVVPGQEDGEPEVLPLPERSPESQR